MDEFIIQELVEDVKLLDEELIEGVNNGSHNTDSMSFDRVQHLIHANGWDLFGINCSFHEDLSMKIVVIFGYKLIELTKKLEDINTLFELLRR